MTGVAVLLAAVAAALWWPEPTRSPDSLVARRGSRPLPGWVRHVALVAVTIGLSVVVLGPRGAPWVLLACALGGTAHLLVVKTLARRRRQRACESVALACQVLAGQLRIGQIPVQALRAAAEDCPDLAEAVAAQAIGGDVPAALRAHSRRPGRAGLEALAAAWELSERSGAPMAAVADEVAADLRHSRDLARSVASELAAPRATGKLLAALPLAGMALGFVSGGSPDRFLLRTLWGNWALAAGVSLACAGVVWTELVADRVERKAWR